MSFNIAVRLSLRTALAPDLAQYSPLRMSLGTSLPGFSRNIPPEPRIHLSSFGNSPLPALRKKLGNALFSRLITHFLRTVIMSVMNSGLKPEGPGPESGGYLIPRMGSLSIQ
eukprot:11912517-Heterocapsa_arctica.AAC.1